MAQTNSRFRTVIDVTALDWRIHNVRKIKLKLVIDAGAMLAESTLPAVVDDTVARDLRERLASVIRDLNTLEAGLRDSFNKDQQDYALASQYMRWIVVARGIFDRLILRDRVRYYRQERQHLMHELGLLVNEPAHDQLSQAVSAPVREDIAKINSDLELLLKDRKQRLVAWNGQVLPYWLSTMLVEGYHYLFHVWKQLLGNLFISIPALGTMIATWWITHSYSDSTLERIQHELGLGGRSYLSPKTLQILNFCLPILVGAFCAYLVATITARIQRKYSPEGEKK